MKHEIKMLRVYGFDDSVAGSRFLVDRVWPRGIAKKDLEPFYWAKEITPTPKLRKWFGHEPERFEEFREKYLYELDHNEASEAFVEKVEDALEDEDVLLLYGAKDPKINHAIILKGWLEEKIK